PSGLANYSDYLLGMKSEESPDAAPLHAPPLTMFASEGIMTSRGLAPLGWRRVLGPPDNPLAYRAIGSNLGAGAEWRIYPQHNAALVIMTRSRYDPRFFDDSIEAIEHWLLPRDMQN